MSCVNYFVLSILFVTTLIPCWTTASFYVLVADPENENSIVGDFFTHSRSRRALTDPDDILDNLVLDIYEGSGMGSGDGEILSREQTLQFFVKNSDSHNSAEMTLRDAMPGNAVLTNFMIHNHGHVYKFDKRQSSEKKQAEREYENAINTGYSTMLVGNIGPQDWTYSESGDTQEVIAILNVRPNDVLSVSLSYVVPITYDSVQYLKDTYKTNVTIQLEESTTSIQGVILSPNYPESYPNNADLSWYINVPSGLLIDVEIISYESEACCDHLYIYDGTSASSTLMSALSGEGHDGNSFRSSGSAVLIKFQSDCLINDGGFSLQFSDFKPDSTNDDTDSDMENLTLKMPRNETFSIYQDQGTISSPGYPVTYPPSSFLTWEITSSPGTFIVLEILNFDVQSGEELCVYGDSNGDVLWKFSTVDVDIYSSYNQHVGVYESAANKLLLSFSTLGKNVNLRGFNAYFHSKTLIPTSDSHYISLNVDDTNWQTLTSPNLPENYDNNMNINWTISTTGDNLIRFEIENLNLEPVYDTLTIIDDNIPNVGKRIGSVSGIGGEKLEHISFNNIVSILFKSDGSITSSGFKINYKVYRVSKSMDETLEWQEGLVMNPEYPSYTYIYNDCYWLIKVNDGFQVNFVIDEIDLYIGNFTVYDGDSKSHEILWFGTYVPFSHGISFVSSSTDVFVSLNLWYSDPCRYAFRFDAVASEPSRNCFYPETLTSAPDAILSPNYPNYYPAGSDCQWLVQASPSYTVSVYIDAISLGYYDSLDFYDGNSTDVVLTHCERYYCYNGMHIGSYDSQMLIKMNSSDSDISGNGFFKLKYTFCENAMCSATDDFTNTVMSPNYPNDYPNMYSEIYSIAVPSGVVYFEFKTFDTESCCDHLDIYDGNSVNSSLIVQLSGYREGFNGQTTGRFLTMMFTTDGSVTRSGFLMKYYKPNATIENNAVYYNLYQAGEYYSYYDYYRQNIILSPGYPGLYPYDVVYYWYFHANADVHAIEFIVHKLDLDSSDFLKFYEYFGVDSTNLRYTLTGNRYHSSPGVYIYNTRATMRLYSDSTFSGEGFNIRYIYHN